MSKTKNTAKKQSKYLGLSFVIDVYKYLSYILLAAGVLGFFIVFFIQTIPINYILIPIGIHIFGYIPLATSEGIKIFLDMEEHLAHIRENTKKD